MVVKTLPSRVRTPLAWPKPTRNWGVFSLPKIRFQHRGRCFHKVCQNWMVKIDYDRNVTFALPSSKSTFSQPFREKCISEVVRIGSIIMFPLSKLWIFKFFKLCATYCGNPIFQTRNAENDTLWGGTYLYGLYMGVPLPRVQYLNLFKETVACINFFTPNFKDYILPTFKKRCIRDAVVRIGSITIFHLSKLWKAKFLILCDVIFLVRPQDKFEINQSFEWNNFCMGKVSLSRHSNEPFLGRITMFSAKPKQLQLMRFNSKTINGTMNYYYAIFYLAWQSSSPCIHNNDCRGEFLPIATSTQHHRMVITSRALLLGTNWLIFSCARHPWFKIVAEEKTCSPLTRKRSYCQPKQLRSAQLNNELKLKFSKADVVSLIW